jgi:hypothetical protein
MYTSYIKGTSEYIPRRIKKSCTYVIQKPINNMASHFISFKDSQSQLRGQVCMRSPAHVTKFTLDKPAATSPLWPLCTSYTLDWKVRLQWYSILYGDKMQQELHLSRSHSQYTGLPTMCQQESDRDMQTPSKHQTGEWIETIYSLAPPLHSPPSQPRHPLSNCLSNARHPDSYH